ncbi:MAG: sugar ABC transporter substrate-binding protein [Anaerolineales bacterium]|nr:sugar ABC transporter substrate-binding protein [Anaerolineales bacterium]
MKRSKTTLVVLSLLVIASLFLVACGGTSPAPTQAPAQEAAPATEAPAAQAPATDAAKAETQAGEKIELTFSVWGDPEELAILQEIADDFAAQNPNVHITVNVSDWDTYWDKLQTTLAAGNPPDVFAMDAPLYPDYQSRDVLLNLQPFIDQDKYDLSGYYEVSLQCYQTADGYYGLPRDVQPSVMYYNKDMFDEAGVPYPDETWTWETLIENGKKLTKDKDGDGTIDQYALWADVWDMELLWASLVWQNQGEILNADYTKTLLAEEGGLGAWQFIHDMMFEHKIMPSPSVAEQFGDPFESGNAAMTPAGHWVVPLYSKVDFAWDVAPLPMGKAQTSIVNSVGFVVAKASKHPQEAWAFLKYLVGEPGQKKITALGLGVPALKSVANSDAYLKQETAPINHKLFLDTMAYTKVKPCFRGYDEWATLIGDGMAPIWLGEAELQPSLEELVPQADQILAEAAK